MFKIFRRKESKQNSKVETLADKLEIAKQKLITDLENNGIEFLISKMASNDEYSELILERRKIDKSYSTEDLVSSYAYRQSDKSPLAQICGVDMVRGVSVLSILCFIPIGAFYDKKQIIKQQISAY